MSTVPRGHSHEVVNLGGGRRQSTILAYPKYRRGANGWEPTRARIVPGGAADWQATEGVHSLLVSNSGNLLLSHPFESTPHLLGMRLSALGVLRGNGTFDEQETPRSAAIPALVAENCLRWTDYFPGVDLDVLYSADQVRTIITIRDDARARLAGYRRSGSRLAFVWETDAARLNYDLGTLEGDPVAWGTSRGTETAGARLAAGGRAKARFLRGVMRRADPRDAAEQRRWSVERRLVFRTRSRVPVMMEVVPWGLLSDAPAGPLVMNAAIAYQEGVDSYSGCQDANGSLYDDDGGASIPYGDENDQYLRVWDFSDDGANGDSWFGFIWIKFIIEADLGLITEAALDLTRVNGGGDEPDDVTTYGCLRDAVEGELNYSEYSSGNDWTTPGAADAGSDHTSDPYADGQTWDGTTSLTINYNATGVAAWNDRQDNGTNYGDLILAVDASGYTLRANKPPDYGGFFYSSEYQTAESRPKLTLTYTEVAAQYLRHRKYLSGSQMIYEIP